jgi:hypothetical protein
MRRDFVAQNDFILNGAEKIGEGRSEHGNQLLESHPVGGHSPTQMVADAIERDQFIHNREIALIERLVKDMPDDGLALNG